IGVITMDNASNNDTLMRELAILLIMAGIDDFCPEGNRIRGLISRVREIITSCRRSGGRREALIRIIEEGNDKHWWGQYANGDYVQLPLLQLLRDCETRWSSTYLLLGRFLLLYPAIMRLCEMYDLDGLRFTDEEHHTLYQVYSVLGHAHHAQELLSSERTPTLSMTIPTYEILLASWRQQRADTPELTHFINYGISKIEEYLTKTLDSRTYAIAMVLNPALKMAWTGDDWVSKIFPTHAPSQLDLAPAAPIRPDLRAFGNPQSEKFADAKGWVVEAVSIIFDICYA
ncbi:hypothetical protein FA13DRAFT_1653261, partial [Coprinellus micaceus]